MSLLSKKYAAMAVVLWACSLQIACAVKNAPTAGNIQTAKVTVDKTFGQYDNALEGQLILVTIEPQQHNELTQIRSDHSADQSLPPEYQEFLDYIRLRYDLERVADWPLQAIDIFCIVFENKGNRDRQQLIAQLAQEPEIESAQAVNTFSVQQDEYNDPFLSLQHGFNSLNAASSHRWSRGRGVRVAVIDTGLDTDHPELQASTLLRRNFVDKNKSQFVADVHGTAVAGVIAAAADNGTGMVGVAPMAELLALKACWQLKEKNNRAVCNSLTLAKALNFAIIQQADIINLSLTGPPDSLLQRLVEKALTENIIVVGAEPPHDQPSFPTVTPGTISVTLPGSNERSSNAEATNAPVANAPVVNAPVVNATPDQSRSVIAPGQKVLSTRPGNQYDFFTGSSFSTAHISGLAALVRELSPELSPKDLLALLNRTADPVSGAVNACNAIVELVKPASFTC